MLNENATANAAKKCKKKWRQKKIRHLLLILVLLPILRPSGLRAQAPCATDAVARRNAGRLPPPTFACRSALEEGRIGLDQTELASAVSPRTVATIQVVVHVVYKSAAENISDDQIYSQLAVLNADFRKSNSNTGAVPPLFLPLAADLELEFCLAAKDPQGNPATGITRQETPWNNIGQLIAPDGRPRIHYTELGGADAWDTEHYLNIWVASIGGGVLGYGTYPGAAPPAEDGVVIDPRYFGATGLAASYPPHHKGRTATHEIGHYFNLLHIWGPDENSCADDDGVADTPTQRAPYLGCPPYPQLSCGNSAMFMNFMDYTDDACMVLFTEGQKSRLWSTLNTVRAGLLDSVFCATTPVGEPVPAQTSIRMYPNPATTEIALESPLFDRECRICVWDMTGRLWKMEHCAALASVLHLDVSDLPAGCYRLFIVSGGHTGSGLLVKAL
ncbi:MAG: hypothetical protein IPH12_09600 [Saprospirales bacterium]|nr:hypothetical protein [Saprospirales bacterium]MBK8921380.1 hypothetical protein [Saprospirales bacterium]